MATENSITLLGVGNILLSDEGVGVHVVNEMRQDYTFTPEINIVDGGTMGMELLSYMRDMKKLLLVDAVQGGEAPGTVYEFLHQETETYFTEHISVHEVGMQDILRIRALQEDPLDDAVVIGVEPMSLDIGLEPTPLVQQAMPDMKQRIIAVLTNWGVEVKKKMIENYSNVATILGELKLALKTLRESGETYTLYIENTGLTQEEQVEVLETLGRGHITITFSETDQPVEWYETRFSGIWVGTFRNGRDEAIVYTVEVARYPSLCGAYEEDMEEAENELQEWIEAATL